MSIHKRRARAIAASVQADRMRMLDLSAIVLLVVLLLVVLTGGGG